MSLSDEYKEMHPYVSIDRLVQVPENFTLYNIFAQSNDGEKSHPIGSIKINGKLIKSKWADENLFFRHSYYDEDIDDYPSWDNKTKKYCPFSHSTYYHEPTH
jgi:hypothetical protein